MNTIQTATVELTYLVCEGVERTEKAQVAFEWVIKCYIA